MIARRYRKTDRAWVEPITGATAIAAKGNHIEVVEDGADRAFAIWYGPDDLAGPAILGVVEAIPPRRDMFYAAILAVIEALIEKGYRAGTADVKDEQVVALLRRGLGDLITVTPVGRNVKTQKVGYWRIDVDPAKALSVLRGLV